MLLKRIYKPGTSELDYISVGHTGMNPEQNFSIDLINEGLERGLMSVVDSTLIFYAHPENLRYTIKREPGHYCLHCGLKLPSDEKGAQARLHVLMTHKGEPAKGAGYEKINHFECVLDAEQHMKFKAPAPGRAVHFPLKGE